MIVKEEYKRGSVIWRFGISSIYTKVYLAKSVGVDPFFPCFGGE